MEEKELQELIDGCKQHDRHSQKLLYQKFYGFAMKICLRYTGTHTEATEVLNDGFFKVFTHIEKYDNNWPFKTWLGKIMYNASIDYYRANLKWRQMDTLNKQDYNSEEITVEHKLGYEDLLSMIRQLPPVYRMVFNLYAIDGYSHEEIAQVMGIEAGTSRSNLYKARLKLQQMLTRSKSVIVLLIWKYRADVSDVPLVVRRSDHTKPS